MATRFYLQDVAAPITIGFSPTWTVTSTQKRSLARINNLTTVDTFHNNSSMATVSGTTRDYGEAQFVSGPIPPQTITGTFSMVASCLENATTDNMTLAVIVRLVSSDGGTVRGTLLSLLGTDTEFATTRATRIVNAATLTSQTAQAGDRIVVEIGSHQAAPTATTAGGVVDYSYVGGQADYALTSALTTTLNPWCEFSQNIFTSDFNNYRFVKAGGGMSVTEKIR